MTTDIEIPAAGPPTITSSLKKFQGVFEKLLAETGISPERFTAEISQAVRATKGLEQCSPETVLGAGLRCAQLGLTPNDGRNHAWIIPRGKEATFQLGYAGIMELARRAEPGLRFDGRPVYPNDEIEVDYGKPEPLTHRPYMTIGKTERGGEPIAWYVKATRSDGTSQVTMLDKEDVEYHRGFSKMGNAGMWKTSYDAAALKSCVVAMKRWLPTSSALATAIASDGETIRLDDIEPVQAGDITPTPEQPEAIEASTS